MSAFQGMDPESVRLLALSLRGSATRISALCGSVDRAVIGARWDGPDGDALRAEWRGSAARQLTGASSLLEAYSRALDEQRAQQLLASSPDGMGAALLPTGPVPAGPPLPGAPEQSGPRPDAGYLHRDDPTIPNWFEDPAEQFMAGPARLWSSGVDVGIDAVSDWRAGLGQLFGRDTSGIDQARRDLHHLNGTITDWTTGERVPTIAEVVTGSMLAGGSTIIADTELISGEDISYLDDRPGGIVHSVDTDTAVAPAPADLSQLILDNNAARVHGEAGKDSGQIRIQEIAPSDGGDSVYIIQVPPTEGGGITDADSWGVQGNSRDWASNVRLESGQNVAAMDDVRAAMQQRGPDGQPVVPPGSKVMFVGHSQGGIVTSHLAADPAFNNTSGQPGSYDVQYSFSAGSPVQTVLPAQSSTQLVNVAHGPLSVGDGDPIPRLDLDGRLIDGRRLKAPNVREVELPGTPAGPGKPWLETNHDSVGDGGDPHGGYAGSLETAQHTDPTLRQLTSELDGRYIGDGATVTRTTTVTVGREDLRGK